MSEFDELRQQLAASEGHCKDALAAERQARQAAEESASAYLATADGLKEKFAAAESNVQYLIAQDRVKTCRLHDAEKRAAAAEAQVAEMRAALEFYAVIPKCKMTTDADRVAHAWVLREDAGDKARAALAKVAQRLEGK